MKKHEKKTVNVNPLSTELIDSYDYLATAASSHDCTGLIPSAPLNPAELDRMRNFTIPSSGLIRR